MRGGQPAEIDHRLIIKGHVGDVRGRRVYRPRKPSGVVVYQKNADLVVRSRRIIWHVATSISCATKQMCPGEVDGHREPPLAFFLERLRQKLAGLHDLQLV